MTDQSCSAGDPLSLLRPRREIQGISAILLPFQSDGQIDWAGFRAHVRRTADARLIPAVNMDTGFGNLLTEDVKLQVLQATREELSGGLFVAGAFVRDQRDDPFHLAGYQRAIEPIQQAGGIPVIFPSYGLTGLEDQQLIDAHQQIAQGCDRFIGFELGEMFVPFGKIFSLEVYEGLLGIPQCIGAKHSSLNRRLEWERIRLRDRVRPDFRVYTGNDLAIDMVMYGSDYLLGLSTFAPDLFAQRDEFWYQGDPRFYEWNDLLQYLGFLVFRPPVPAYKHSAAMFLKLRGWIACDETHPQSPQRPDSDRELLQDIVDRMNRLL